MSYYLVRCETLQYEIELLVCLTRLQFDKLKYKIENNLITHKILIANGSDTEDVKIKITEYILLSKLSYDQIKNFIGNHDLIDKITNKTKCHFWYTRTKDSYIIDDFIKNKLNKLEHDEYEFIFSEGGMGSLHISQMHGKVVLKNDNYKSIKGIDLPNKEIIDFLLL